MTSRRADMKRLPEGTIVAKSLWALACGCRDMFTMYETRKEAELDKSFNDHRCQSCRRRIRLFRYRIAGTP